jgi:hypothetical protein
MTPKRNLHVATALLAVVYGVWTWQAGVRTSIDTVSHSNWADLLISLRFNIVLYLRDNTFVVPPVLYLLWITLVATLKTLLGASWMSGVLVLNWIAFCTGSHLTLAAVRRLTASTLALALAFLLFLVAADLLIFIPFVLSDLTFWGLSTTVLVCGLIVATRRFDGGDPVPIARTVVFGSVLLAAAMAFRPVALPLAVFWLLSLAASRWPDAVLRLAIPLFAMVAIVALAVVAMLAYVLVTPAAWPFGELPGILKMLSEEYQKGVLTYGPDAFVMVAPASSWAGALRLTAQKWAYFVTPWLPHYSTAHTLLNLAFFVPVYGLGAAALANWRRLASWQQLALWLLTAYALTLSAFHAIMQVDYDHRYRLPLLPALIIMAALGLEALRRPARLISRPNAS